MNKMRLDQLLVKKGLATTRSQAANYLQLGFVSVNGQVVSKSGLLVDALATVQLKNKEQYVSRAAYKLASVANSLKLDFKDKVVLDVGSSTGGFTDFALRHGAKKVIAVDVGTKQMHPSLMNHPRVELHEQTDIRQFKTGQPIDMVLIDVSFISLRAILPSLTKLIDSQSLFLAMAKPQFEAQKPDQKHGGIIKNNRVRRAVLKDFENWVQKLFVIVEKADSEVPGAKGNIERFYLLKPLKK